MYFVSRNGVQQGPHSLEEINSLLSAGQLSASDLAWQEGMAQWEPLSRIPGVNAAGGPPPMPGGVPAVRSAYQPPQSNVAPQGMAAGPPSTSGMAIASLVLGILCLLLFFTHIFALIIGLLAVIFGHVSRGAINRSRGRLGGGGMALAGLITGYIGMVLAIILLIVAAVFVTKMMDEGSEFGKIIRDAAHQQQEEMRKQNERLNTPPPTDDTNR